MDALLIAHHPSEPALQPSQVFANRYRIVYVVGHSVFATVYRAFDLEKRQDVALKILHCRYRGDPQLVAFFAGEAAIAQTLHHPNIRTVFDYVETSAGDHYLVMEFLPGIDAGDWKRSMPHRVPLRSVLWIAQEVCRALTACATAGIVLRDLKPENIVLVDQEGAAQGVQLIDLGVAVRRVPKNQWHNDGFTPGTPAYMAPEQMRGEAPEYPADQFSLGVIVHELLTGKLPYGPLDETIGPEDMLWRYHQRMKKRRPDFMFRSRRDAPLRLDLAVQRMVAFNPQDRFADPNEVAAELGALAAQYPPVGGWR